MRKSSVVLCLFTVSAVGQQQVPFPVSVTPSYGAGFSQTFTFVFSDPDGWQDLGVQNVLIQKDFLDGRNACYLAYSRPLGVIYLVKDDGSGLVPGELVPGSGGSLSNSQCTIYGTGSSANGSGITLTLALNMSFTSGFAGNRIVWLAARDLAEHNSYWQALGVWNIPGSPPASPAVVSLDPRRGIGQGPVSFTSQFSDSDGWLDLGVQNILINATLDGRNACYLAYSRPYGVLYLVNNEGTGYAGQLVLGSGASVSNSQCTIYGTGSSASGGGTTLTLVLNMSFTSGFAGNRIVWLAARDMAEHNSGWQSLGTWTVPAQQYTTIAALNQCISSAPPGGICALAPTTHPVTTTPILVGRSDVTVTGGSTRPQTRLVRHPAFTEPIIRVDAGSALAGITIQNLTVCGSAYQLFDLNLGQMVTLDPSPVGCPRVQTTCGEMVRRITQSYREGYPPPQQEDHPCVDLEVSNVDVGLSSATYPFSYAGLYGLEVNNVDFEDATGHAISLYAYQHSLPKFPGPDKKVKDVYIHDSAINFSAVTGILYGTNGVTYDNKYCDHYRDHNPLEFRDDPVLFAPRNIRIEGNKFEKNNTGAMGGGATRWLGLRNNTFTNNYIHPQVGNNAGGTVQLDGCADKVEVLSNTFTGPGSFVATSALELYSRNITVSGNTVSGYGSEGINAASLAQASIAINNVKDNGWGVSAGGIQVVTSFAPGPCDPIPRDTDGVTVSGNFSGGQMGATQAYGVHLRDYTAKSANRLFGVAVSSNTIQNTVAPVRLDRFVGLYDYSPPGSYTLQTLPSPLPNPRALPVDVTVPASVSVPASWPPVSRCSDDPYKPPPPGTRKGSYRALFRFSASDISGASNLAAIHGALSYNTAPLLPDATQGGPSSPGVCNFAYDPVSNWVYLDDANVGFTFPLSSAVGTGGSDIGGPGTANPNCTIHGATSSSWKTVPPSQAEPQEYLVDVTLDVQLPTTPARSYHLYLYTQNFGGDYNVLDPATRLLWTYYGYWWNVEQ